MDNIQQFIDIGWHTFPHTKQTISRNQQGQKIFGFPKAWQEHKDNFNEVASAVGSVIPGEQSNLIVIDCDSTEATELMELLLPKYEAKTYSIGKVDKDNKPINGSKWFFTYTPNIATIHNGPYKLEVFTGDNDTQNVFLPTKNNLTSTPWSTIPAITELPPQLITVLDVWARAATSRNVTQSSDSYYAPSNSFNLAPLVEKQLSRTEIIPELFGIITPKSFRGKLYQEQGYLTPTDIADGSGSEYLSKVSAILGSDKSISKDLYQDFILYINEMWEHPMPQKRLDDTITRGMLDGTKRINNRPIWQYDENWEQARFMDYNKVEQLVEYYMDPATINIVEVNHTNNLVRELRSTQLNSILTLLTTKVFKGKNKVEAFQLAVPAMHTVTEPKHPFGPLPHDRFKFNRFRMTPAMEVLQDPEIHRDFYKPPINTIAMFKNLIPDKEDRDYILSHLHTKLTTFEYSPVVYYFVGVQGSGKGVFTTMIANIIGEDNVFMDLGASEVIGTTNQWLEGKFFVNFNELHDSLPTAKEKRAANGNIKKWTGAKNFALRKMRTDPYKSPMLATFILTQNGDTFQMEIGDRRYQYTASRNKLDANIGHGSVNEDPKDIAYYIATTYPTLSREDYMEPPMTEAKIASILEKQPAHVRIINHIERKDYEGLYKLAMECGATLDELTAHRARNHIHGPALVNLYRAIAVNTTKEDSEILAMFKALTKKTLVGQPERPYINNTWYLIAQDFDNSCEPLLDEDNDNTLPEIASK